MVLDSDLRTRPKQRGKLALFELAPGWGFSGSQSLVCGSHRVVAQTASSIMASSVDANVGTLLFHLNQMRHPTRMEARLQQISDEYLLLTESLGKQKAPAAKKTGKISLEELLDRLRDELESNLVPLPDAPTCS